MSQPKGFAQPIDALLAVATCLGGFTIANEAGTAMLTPEVFLGDYPVGGVIDCCRDGKPIMRIETAEENPAEGVPLTLSKQGCWNLSMPITVTFLTCMKTMTNKGQVITDPQQLTYTKVIQAARWDALRALRCCANPNIKYLGSKPIPSDGKCGGFEIRLTANLSVCGCPESASS